MRDVPAINFKDGYKADHRRQYPINTVKVYSNFTPRKSRDEMDSVIFFGLAYFIKDVFMKEFEETFFKVPEDVAVAAYARRMKYYLGGNMDLQHIRSLHKLGYLPVLIKALPEGSLVKMGVPVLTITNEIEEFFWLPNFLETIISTEVWPCTTSATTIFKYRLIFDEYALKTVGNTDFSSTNQIHDFSMRGMFGRYAAFMSGMAHLLGSNGTDTIGAIDFLEMYYNADVEKEVIGNSIPATEHSVMCMGKKDSELQTFKRLITEIYPSGPVGVVSDTWNLWNVCTWILPQLKEVILARTGGPLVIRPDSGNPVRILCGDVFEEFANLKQAEEFYIEEVWRIAEEACGKKTKGQPAYEFKYKVGDEYYSSLFICTYDKDGKYNYLSTVAREPSKQIERDAEEIGVVELLWNVFGGTMTEKGYKLLDSHISCIYGDSITTERAKQICQRLMDKGFASINWVAGVGSFTYQYTTRDQYGFAMKATYGELRWPMINVHVNSKGQLVGECPEVVEGEVIIDDSGRVDVVGATYTMVEERNIFKDPITDDGTKRSAKGRLVVYKDEYGNYFMQDQVEEDEEEGGDLAIVWQKGKLIVDPHITEIRERFNEALKRKLAA